MEKIMMKAKLMTAVSVLALLTAMPAYAAATYKNVGGGEGKTSTTASASATASTTPAADGPALKASDTPPRNIGEAVKAAADDIRGLFLGKDAKELEPVLIQRDRTAHGLIDQPVRNAKGEKIAEVKDIIIGKDGTAKLVVVSDGGVLGIGSKVAAFDYGQAVTQGSEGRTTVNLSQNMIDRAADFSYDQKDWREAKVIPAGSVSVNELLKGDILDNEGKKVASVENVYLRNNEASQVIVGFDKTFGMGGKLAVLDFDDLQMVKNGDDVDFKLNTKQTAQFKNYKDTVTN
jgi:sporulation protein YlmC with PRC-barrel domain